MHRIRNFALIFMAAAAAYGAPVDLRCEYLKNPIGIDTAPPQLSWRSDNRERNWKQSAYRIQVATSPQQLRGKPDVWDSGRQASAESNGIVYGGPKLESRKRYYWTVRVWDAKGKTADAAQPAYWEMGLLAGSDWSAKWITRQDTERDADWAAMRWVWAQGQDAFAVPSNASATFRLEVDLPAKPSDAGLYVYAHNAFTARVNGKELTSKSGWVEFDRQDISPFIVAGRNTIEVTATAPGGRGTTPRIGGMAALLKITRADGSIDRYPTGDRWQARLGTETEWKPAVVAATLDDSRLGLDRKVLPGAAALLRKNFEVSKRVRAARLYVTALGSYRAFLNGKRVGEDMLTPEFTQYNKRVIYQTYDVTPMLAQGRNAVAAMLGDGWYASGMFNIGRRFSLAPPPARFLAQLEIEYTDGSRSTVATDPSWKTAPSPILHSEIYAGEVYDAQLERAGWNQPQFDDSQWASAAAAEAPAAVVSSQMQVPARIVDTLKPKTVTPLAGGAYLFDMGQNMVGWVRLKVAGVAGTAVRLRFAEILDPQGNIYTTNLRGANVTDTYILRGGGEETWAPEFTFHGFRYVEISGYPGAPGLDAITGEVVSSVDAPSGKLTTSSDLVNSMYKLGIWGQRGNFLSIPTDCPQRDERLGWTGDAEVFWRTGTYNMDLAAFSRYFMRTMVDAQNDAGAFPDVAPNVLGQAGAPGWGDAGVILPWTAWVQYGDKGIIRENWNGMERWMKYIGDANPDFIRKNKNGNNYADWLPAGTTTPNSTTTPVLVGTAYWALIADMMSQMSHATGREDDAKRYAELYQNIRAAFQKEYVKENGEVGPGTQTAYVLALHMKLVPDSLRATVLGNLVKDIEKHDGHLTTGFLGTPFLLFELADNGRPDVAYRLLLNETFPSWGYMIRKGATTWWERWNGDTGDPAMNSYNHYAFGSVMAWVYRRVAGIDTTTSAPGFREIDIHPLLDARLTSARGEYDSIYGKIVSDWTGTPNGPFTLKLTVPANTTAKVTLPAIANAKITEGGKTIPTRKEDAGYVVQVGSGTYEFQVK